jgi:hypothetical protein
LPTGPSIAIESKRLHTRGGTRTHGHSGLSRAARPLAYPGSRGGSRGTRTHKRSEDRRPLSRRAPDPAGWLPISSSSGGWNRTSGLRVQSAASLPAATAPDHGFPTSRHIASMPGSGGRNRTCELLVQGQEFLPAETTPESAQRESNPPVRVGSPVPRRSAKGTVETQRKERESNPQGSALARFRVGCRHRSACPSVLNATHSTGGRNRTCELLLNREAHVPAHAAPVLIIAVGAAGFEPALSWSQARRISRLSHTPKGSSAQRESNPHFRHGMTAGCRYIMGTMPTPNCQRIRAPGGTRTHVAALRVRCPRR